MDKEMKINLRKVREGRAADKAIRWCATYEVTKGFTCQPNMSLIMKTFAEMKVRLKNGSFRNITHLKAYVISRYGVPEDKMS